MQIRSALRTDRLCKSLTGLTVAEFTNLVSDFSWNYHEYEAKRITERKRKLGGGRGSKDRDNRRETLLRIVLP